MYLGKRVACKSLWKMNEDYTKSGSCKKEKGKKNSWNPIRCIYRYNNVPNGEMKGCYAKASELSGKFDYVMFQKEINAFEATKFC